MREADALLTGLQKEATSHNARLAQWNDTLSAQLQQLRDTIAQARHAANGVSMSLNVINTFAFSLFKRANKIIIENKN